MRCAEFRFEDLKRDYRDNDEFLLVIRFYLATTRFITSLLGSKLWLGYTLTHPLTFLYKSNTVDAVIRAQNPDDRGCMVKVPLKVGLTVSIGFNPEALNDYARFTGDESVLPSMEAGFGFTKSFFTTEGFPNTITTASIQLTFTPAQLVFTIRPQSRKISRVSQCVQAWTIQNMQSNQGL